MLCGLKKLFYESLLWKNHEEALNINENLGRRFQIQK